MNYYGYEFVRESDLQHYGLKGMHWGTRHWQNYDSTNSFNEAGIMRYFGRKPGKDTEAAKQPKVFHKSSIKKTESSNLSNDTENKMKKQFSKTNSPIGTGDIVNNSSADVKRASKLLGLSPEETERMKKVAKIAGISLATTAGVFLVGYMLTNKNAVSELIKTAESDSQKVKNVNADPFKHTVFGLNDSLFKSRFNDQAVGMIAENHGFGETTSDILRHAIENPTALGEDVDYDALIRDMRVNQISPGSSRRLSCWSASNSYFLSILTGDKFCSRSFTNLADFNDFGKLYTKKPKIFSLNGEIASDFVGKFGGSEVRANHTDAMNLIKSIANNISESNNLSPDGSRTVGFINAGYHGMTCTHQWNFELVHSSAFAGSAKDIFISDGWSGERYCVASIRENGQVAWANGMAKFADEMHHYNANSVRFYAPSLQSVDPDMMSKVVLGHYTNGQSPVRSTQAVAKAASNVPKLTLDAPSVSKGKNYTTTLLKNVQGISAANARNGRIVSQKSAGKDYVYKLLVQQYRRMYPGTELSDKEIARNMGYSL